MIKKECKHEWSKKQNFHPDFGASIYFCNKCKEWMSAAEIFQLEALLNTQGFQKYIAIIALIISFLALLVSVI